MPKSKSLMDDSSFHFPENKLRKLINGKSVQLKHEHLTNPPKDWQRTMLSPSGSKRVMRAKKNKKGLRLSAKDIDDNMAFEGGNIWGDFKRGMSSIVKNPTVKKIGSALLDRAIDSGMTALESGAGYHKGGSFIPKNFARKVKNTMKDLNNNPSVQNIKRKALAKADQLANAQLKQASDWAANKSGLDISDDLFTLGKNPASRLNTTLEGGSLRISPIEDRRNGFLIPPMTNQARAQLGLYRGGTFMEVNGGSGHPLNRPFKRGKRGGGMLAV
jgi:hypothetical protein